MQEQVPVLERRGLSPDTGRLDMRMVALAVINVAATLAVYLDVYNVFQSLLSILGVLGGERE